MSTPTAVIPANKKQIQIDMRKIIGKGYGSYSRARTRYRVVKGGRGSKKSKTAALLFISDLMEYPLANLLVIRKHFNTHKDSTFADLKWATHQLHVAHLWKFTMSPLMGVYKPTGQRILFRGLDDSLKITSITVEKGFLCWQWWEEVYEITSEKEFDTIDETLRGAVPAPLWKQITITYNPWVVTHWTKKRFWDVDREDTFRLTTTHLCNEFLDAADHKKIEDMQITNPERYKVVGLGEYGTEGGNFFDEFRSDIHVCPTREIPSHWSKFFTMDYGLDMFAPLWIAMSPEGDAEIYKEYNSAGLVVSVATKKAKQITDGDNIECWYAPPDLWAKNAETGRSQQEAFWDQGKGLYLTMSKNARAAGCSALAEWLHPFEYTDPITGETKVKARLRVQAHCTEIINNLSMIKRNEAKPNEYDNEPHEYTHNVDSLRGWAIMRTYPPVPPLAKAIVDNFDMDIHQRVQEGLYD
jgi:phage terminase large subunit